MKVKELIDTLQKMDPESNVITSFWNGHVDTYTLITQAFELEQNGVESDYFGAPGALDYDVWKSDAETVVFLRSNFVSTDKRVFYARRVLWRIQLILNMHRSREWKKERVYRELKELDEDQERIWFDNWRPRMKCPKWVDELIKNHSSK